MIATANSSPRYDDQFGNEFDADQFERFSYRDRGSFPVRSHAARSRAKMRSRGTAAYRQKARAFHGVNRRGRGKEWCLAR
ncbi:MAG: hypothetical protein IT425_12060 [Pirellulales bacterium]|nr:hypothetical protein [Pirellulales bacterium]